MKITATLAAISLVVAGVVTAAEHTSRELIIGGTVIEENTTPWVCSLRYSKGGESQCGAALIAKNYVITTAECAGKPPDVDSLYVSCNSLHVDGEMDGEQIKVVEVHNHSMHVDATYLYNFAVLTLEKATTIKPVKLPNKTLSVPAGTWATAYGWGTFADFKLQYKDMRSLELPVWSNEDCLDIFSLINEAHLCAGSVMSHDICNYDEGIPFVLKNAQGDGEDVLIALGGFSLHCGEEENVPSLFNRVSFVVDWIKSIICADGQQCP